MDEILIKLINPNLPCPAYKTAGAVAFDLAASQTTEIPPRSVKMIPLGVAIQPPEGYWILMAARSSLHKKGLMPANNVAIMDADYCGNDDEYLSPLYNFTDQPVLVEEGERIVQAILLPLKQCPIRVVEQLNSPNRGSFGTTGSH